MIASLTKYAAERWGDWFGEEAPGHLTPALLAAGPAHGDRAFVLLWPQGETAPRVFLKVAFAPREAGFLQREFRALSRVRPSVPAHLREEIPDALDLRVNGTTTVLAQRALRGRRLLVPYLLGRGSPSARRLVARHLRRVFSWSDELGKVTSRPVQLVGSDLAQTAHSFLVAFVKDPATRATVRSFAKALEHSDVRWHPSWQHGDVSVGNVLVHRGRPRLLDWEHAQEGVEPWFDVAYAPGAMALLASHQAGGRGPIHAAALRALGPRTWPGSLLRREMVRAWDHPAPLPWAVIVALMRTALRRYRGPHDASYPTAELASALLVDDEFRRSLGWLAPEW